MRRHSACLTVLTALVFGTPVMAQQQPRPNRPRPEFIASDATLPFSQAVRVGDMIYLSGVIGDSANTVVGGGIKPETRRAMENIRSTLEKLGGGMDDVVKCTVFLADIKEWAAMNEVYVSFFPNHRPARSALGTTGLVRNARVEIECLAAAR